MTSRLCAFGLPGIVRLATLICSVLWSALASAQSCIPISTINALQSIGNVPTMPLSGNYCLTNDIDASVTPTWNGGAGFLPIGSPANPFLGSFDGKAYVISGLHIGLDFTSPPSIIQATDFVGLFGYIGSTGIVRNLGLGSGALINGRNQVGGIAGQNDGTIDNSYVEGTVSHSVFYQSTNVGGLVGLNTGTITNSRVVSTSSTGLNNIGGLVGYNTVDGIIANSYANSGVTSGSFQDALSANNAGGLVGNNFGTISQSYAASGIVGINYVGGLVGVNEPSGIIKQSFAIGDAYGGTDIGGLVGTNRGTVTQTYATGRTNPSGNAGVAIGGLVGDNSGGISQSYATGLVGAGGGFGLGGLVGAATATATATASYWDTQTTGESTSGGGTGWTTVQLKAGLPSDFDSTVWGIGPAFNDGYPYLLWQLGQAPAPTVTATAPTSGAALGSTSVAITGTNFTGATAVKFGSANALSFTVNNATSIAATSPAGSGVVDVTVTTPSGTSATGVSDQFTYIPATAGPVITANPSPQTVNAGQTATFTASASGTPTPTGQWQQSTDGGVTFTNIAGATSMTYTTPSTTASQNGYQYQAVFSNSVSKATTTVAILTVRALWITSVSPNPVIGSTKSQTLTINGQNFAPKATVTLRDLTAGQTFANKKPTTSNSNGTQLTVSATFTIAADNWSVEVINANGQSSGQFPFQVVAPPAPVLSVTPPSPQVPASAGLRTDT
jgi:large repetitive protein